MSGWSLWNTQGTVQCLWQVTVGNLYHPKSEGVGRQQLPDPRGQSCWGRHLMKVTTFGSGKLVAHGNLSGRLQGNKYLTSLCSHLLALAGAPIGQTKPEAKDKDQGVAHTLSFQSTETEEQQKVALEGPIENIQY